MKAVYTFLAFAVLGLTAGTSQVQAATSNNNGQKTGEVFKASLAGNNEVPSVNTKATGSATFEVVQNGDALHYRVMANDISNVTAMHIHLKGKKGVEQGPPIVMLYSGPKLTGPTNGVLAEGTITKSNLTGPLAGKNISDLVKDMKAGKTYINVHTTEHPNGEISGGVVR